MNNPTDKSAVNPPQNPADTKSTVRQRMLQARQNMTVAERMLCAQQIANYLDYVFKNQGIKTAAAYLPIRGELDVTTFCAKKSSEVQWLLPYCTELDNDRRLAFLPWLPGEALSPGRYNIPIPTRHLQTSTEPIQHALPLPSIQAILLPCVSVNPRGYRLGYGAGWYDRTLSRHSGDHLSHSRDPIRHSRESGNPAHSTVIPAIPTVIPAKAGIQPIPPSFQPHQPSSPQSSESFPRSLPSFPRKRESSPPLLIGLVYHDATLQNWQEEPHDKPLDLWITERGIFGGASINL